MADVEKVYDDLRQRIQCTSQTTAGKRCKAWAIQPMNVCYSHGAGGNMELHLQSKALHSARAMMLTYGGRQEGDPGEILLEEIARTNGHVLWLEGQVTSRTPRDLAANWWLFKRSTDAHVRWDETAEANADESFGGVWLELYMKERTHLHALCKTALSAGIEERRVRLAEAQGQRLGLAIVQMLKELKVDTEAPHVRGIVYRALMNARGADLGEMEEVPNGSAGTGG